MIKKITKKEFKEILNKEVGYNWVVNKRRKATKRPYGDYIYSADKEMFDYQYKKYINGEE